MFVYNVTVTLEKEIHSEWLLWMRENHIPDVMRTGCFTEHKIGKLVTNEDEITYAIQYTFKERNDLTNYQQNHAPRLQKIHSEKFQNKFIVFRSILEIL